MAILLKGINRLSKQQPELQFRRSLVRSTLQLDTIPTEETVSICKLEQPVHKVRPTSTTTRPTNPGGATQLKSVQTEKKEWRWRRSNWRKGDLQALPHAGGTPKRTVMQVGAPDGGQRQAMLHMWLHPALRQGLPQKGRSETKAKWRRRTKWSEASDSESQRQAVCTMSPQATSSPSTSHWGRPQREGRKLCRACWRKPKSCSRA